MPSSRALSLEYSDRLARAEFPAVAADLRAARRRSQLRRSGRAVALAAGAAVTVGLATAPQLEAGTPPAEQR